MTFDDLKSQAYQLIEGHITLEDFSSWYRLALASEPQTIQPAEKPFIPPPVKPTRFSDYTNQEPDADMREHHRRLLGSGEQE